MSEICDTCGNKETCSVSKLRGQPTCIFCGAKLGEDDFLFCINPPECPIEKDDGLILKVGICLICAEKYKFSLVVKKPQYSPSNYFSSGVGLTRDDLKKMGLDV